MVEVLQLHNALATDTTDTPLDPLDRDCHSYNGEINGITSLVNDHLDYAIALAEHKKSCRLQVHDLKSMLKEVDKCNRKNKLEIIKYNEKSDQIDGDTENSFRLSTSAVAAVFADILLQARMDLAERWDPLCLLEKDLFTAVLLDYRKVQIKIISMYLYYFIASEVQRVRMSMYTQHKIFTVRKYLYGSRGGCHTNFTYSTQILHKYSYYVYVL